MRIISLLIVFFLNILFLFAQPFKIGGTIKDGYGTPIPYASIVLSISPTRIIARANKDGVFFINNAYNGDTLVCRHVNYVAKKEVIEGNDTVNFILDKAPSLEHAVKISMPGKKKIDLATLDKRKSWACDECATQVQIPASFPGNSEMLSQFLELNIIYPDTMKTKNIFG